MKVNRELLGEEVTQLVHAVHIDVMFFSAYLGRNERRLLKWFYVLYGLG
jgi:hypothetical protein